MSTPWQIATSQFLLGLASGAIIERADAHHVTDTRHTDDSITFRMTLDGEEFRVVIVVAPTNYPQQQGARS